MRILKLTKDSQKNILESLLKRSPNNYTEYESTVNEIINNVKENRDKAVFEYTKKFDKAILQYDKEQAEILRFSPNVLKGIKEEFEMNIYINKNEIKGRLQAIYDEHSIRYKVTQDTIKDYYDTDNSGSKNGGSYKLTAFKFCLVDF